MDLQPLTSKLIYHGYLQGAFPMADEDGRVSWYQPRRRALLPLSGIHVSRSLRRTLDAERFEITFDLDFPAVVTGCRRPEGTWINDEIAAAFTTIWRQGWGHSAECRLDGELVGGVYGIAIGACFCAESMFYRVTDASKVALAALVDRCADLGFEIFDVQVLTPHLASLGAFEISHEEYMRHLRRAALKTTSWSLNPPRR